MIRHAAPDIPAILEALAGPGWCVARGFLGRDHVAALAAECRQAHAAGAFHPAGVGRGQSARREEIRGDHVVWVDDLERGPALGAALDRLEDLRQVVNRTLFLGLFDAELHFALYPPGAGYQRHLDRFRDDDRRTLTTILYLNADWQAEDGGLLRFWPEADGPHLDIPPLGGTLVTFLSDRFWHEVLPAHRERLSLTGWFRRR
ncbi:MAG: 2OG-Fe(II) oxygenase [Pseudomonadota bacterium]